MLMAGVMATLLVGNLLSSLSPMYIGALMESLHLTESDAGLVMTVELIAAAAALTLFSRRLVAFPPFRLAAAGTAVVITAQLASAFATYLPALLCVRALSGIGASFALLAASMLISRRPDPDRYIAIAMVGTTLVFTAIMGICGIAIARYGLLGFYLVAAGTAVLLLPLFIAIRPGAERFRLTCRAFHSASPNDVVQPRCDDRRVRGRHHRPHVHRPGGLELRTTQR